MAKTHIGDLIGCIVENGEQIPLHYKNVKVVISKPRSQPYHNHVFNVLAYTLKYMNPRAGINSTQRLLLAFKDYHGMFDVIVRKDGSEIRDYHSISFGSMDEIEFRELVPHIHEFCSILLAHCDKSIMEGLIQRMRF